MSSSLRPPDSSQVPAVDCQHDEACIASHPGTKLQALLFRDGISLRACLMINAATCMAPHDASQLADCPAMQSNVHMHAHKGSVMLQQF